MKKIILCALSFLLCGCIQTTDHLYIEQDGSGVIESQMTIPAGTVKMIDVMLGGMVQAMSEAFELPEEDATPASIADQMFSKEEILKKAQAKGLNVEMVYFDKTKDDEGIHLKYKMKFDDIQHLLYSEIVAAKISLKKDQSGNWICVTKSDPQKAEEGKMQIGQFEDFRKSEQFQRMDAAVQEKVFEAMSNLKLEFLITMPYVIKKSTGMFKKINENTASLEFSGDVFKNPALIEKLYGMTEESKVVWDGKEMSKMSKASAASPEKEAHKANVKIYLKSGQSIEGELIEETPQYFKIKKYGVTMTYYADEVAKIEPQ